MTHEQIQEAVDTMHELTLLHRLAMRQAAMHQEVHFGQIPILDYIFTHDGCTQRDVADQMGISPPSVATSIKRMQRAGLVEKRGDERDLRVTRLGVTPLGRENVLACRRAVDEINACLFGRIEGEDADCLIRMMHIMADNLRENVGGELERFYEEMRHHTERGRHDC